MKKVTVALLLGCMFSLTGSKAQVVELSSENGGCKWMIVPQEEVGENPGPLFDDSIASERAIAGVVPGTVFASYVMAGQEADPNVGDNIIRVNRAKYNRSFWYFTQFKIPESFTKEEVWLNFNGVNRSALIYLNGRLLGKLDGFMQRGCYNINNVMVRSGLNRLAVLVKIPDTPLANEGSPNYLSSGGWDWMPYVPGLNSGITDKVSLSNTGCVTLANPWMRTTLPSRAKGELSLTVTVKNNSTHDTKSIVKGRIDPGGIVVEQEVALAAGQSKCITFDKKHYPAMVVNSPHLWWPNGYGEPNLYACRITAQSEGSISDEKEMRFGIRQYSYSLDGGVFHLLINGTPIFVKGGNWGMSEYMLRCRGQEYDTKIRLHKEMNFNMIRNWLGSTTDEEFYDCCDRYGIMVWDDFWINSNPNLPNDLTTFHSNVVEKIKRLRNHPCIAVWCGDNEARPQAPLEGWMREDIKTFDGGDRYFQPCSNAWNLSGSGPWGAHDARWYFTPYPNYAWGNGIVKGWGFRTEIGTAVVPNVESIKRFIPTEHLWPIDEMWNLHYFGSNAANATPDNYVEMINREYGKPANLEEFCKKAQLLNMESNKAMYEGWLDHMWEDATGIMTWMSQSAYPSMVWQTYDYYYDLTGAYWGCKQACEPLHIFWNAVTDEIKVANTTAHDYEGLTATATIYNLNGKAVAQYSKEAEITSPSNTTVQCFTMDFNRNREVVSLGSPAYASSTSYGEPAHVTDGKEDTRWAARKADNEWITIDLKSVREIGGIRLNWEAAYGKAYKIQISNDGQSWEEIYKTDEGHEGVETITFPEKEARYVRMLGIELGWWFGYSLWSFDVLSPAAPTSGVDEVHFLRLELKDKAGKCLSQNTYWRGNKRCDYTAIERMKRVEVKVTSALTFDKEKGTIKSTLSLPAKAQSAAFAVHVQVTRDCDGERLLPAIMSDNYFTLMPGEKREITIEFDKSLLKGGGYHLTAVPYNNKLQD